MYKCTKCDREFANKDNLSRHLNKKIPCDENAKKLMINAKRKCITCDKVFASMQALKYHMNGKCKAKNSDMMTSDDDLINDQHRKGINFEILIEILKENQKCIEEKNITIENLRKENEQLKIDKSNCDKSTTVNGNANIQNAETINNNTIQNIHNEIRVLAFDKTDMSHITDDIYEKILNRGFKSVINYIEMIHFNKDKPENHNIQIRNWRDGLIDIYNGEGWDKHDGDNMLQQIYRG